MAAILSPLGLYGGNLKTKLPLRPKLGYTPTKGTLGNCLHNTIRRMPATANLLSLDARLGIPTRVLRFKVSGLRRRTLVRPVLLTGQTGQTHRSNRSGAAAPPSSVLRSWLCGSTKEPSGFLVNHWKPRKLGVATANRHL
jgi:hypothetical protein